MIGEYYAFLSTLINLVSDPLRDLSLWLNLPLATALLLGLIGAASPCQLTTNISALAYVSRQAGQPRAVIGAAFAYLLGKVTVYSLVGLLIIGLGLGLDRQSIPVAVTARKVLGPAMIVGGLVLLGLVRLRFSLGDRLGEWLARKHSGGEALQPFLLGVGFSFAFCPTLFLLFFGLLMPLALSSPAGVVFPAVFALGTTLPLVSLAAVFGLTAAGLRSRLGDARRWGRYANVAAGLVFLLAGLNDTLVYWLL